MTTIRIELGREALEALRRPVAGHGGFQGRLDTDLNELAVLANALLPLAA